MQCYFKHLKVITSHKIYVMLECFKKGLFVQGILHDLSKYSFTEFFNSAKYFQGDGSPIAKEKHEKKYSIAWLHHKARNKHHWDYWVDFCDGELVMVPMPDRYIKEMFCDMIGASKAYTGRKFSKREPLDYFLAHKDAWKMHEGSKEKLQEMLIEYAAGEP